ncbi:hypothetical protein MKD33_01455, partial [Chromobacterium piscinae]
MGLEGAPAHDKV